jgi:hypothetical protein
MWEKNVGISICRFGLKVANLRNVNSQPEVNLLKVGNLQKNVEFVCSIKSPDSSNLQIQ